MIFLRCRGTMVINCPSVLVFRVRGGFGLDHTTAVVVSGCCRTFQGRRLMTTLTGAIGSVVFIFGMHTPHVPQSCPCPRLSQRALASHSSMPVLGALALAPQRRGRSGPRAVRALDAGPFALTAAVREARGLKNLSTFVKMDPYAVVSYAGRERRTPTAKSAGTEVPSNYPTIQPSNYCSALPNSFYF